MSDGYFKNRLEQETADLDCFSNKKLEAQLRNVNGKIYERVAIKRGRAGKWGLKHTHLAWFLIHKRNYTQDEVAALTPNYNLIRKRYRLPADASITAMLKEAKALVKSRKAK